MSCPIFLVRHGEADAHWGQSADPGLSTLGREQAETCARDLAPLLKAEALLVSSPLARAIETAAPLARRTGLDVTPVESYREIPAPVPLVQRRDWLRGFMREEWKSQGDALVAWREALLSALYATRSPTVIFTHFLVINTVVGHIREADRTLSFWPDNGSVTELLLRNGTLELITLGREMDTVIN